MGVIKQNYQVKRLNETLDVAYGAIIGFSLVEDNVWRATFAIAQTRDNATKGYAYEKVHVDFEWDRKCNPIPLAYEKAKQQKTVLSYNEQEYREEFILVDNIFTGWVDDINLN